MPCLAVVTIGEWLRWSATNGVWEMGMGHADGEGVWGRGGMVIERVFEIESTFVMGVKGVRNSIKICDGSRGREVDRKWTMIIKSGKNYQREN